MLQFYLCSQLKSFKKETVEKDSLQKEVVKATLKMLMLAQQSPDSSLINKLVRLENAIERTQTNIEAEKNILYTLSSILKIKFTGDWNEEPYPPYVLSSTSQEYFLIFRDSKNVLPRIEFYGTETYQFKKVNKDTSEFICRQAVKDGSFPMGQSIDNLNHYDIIEYFVPFILYNNFKTPYINIFDTEIDLIINGKNIKRIHLSNQYKQEVKIYNNHKSAAWAIISLKTNNGSILDYFK